MHPAWAPEMCKFAHMDSVQARQRARIAELLTATGLDPTGLAKAAGLASTTLTRMLNSANHKYALSARTIAAVEAAAERLLGRAPSAGMAESQQATAFQSLVVEWERLPEVSAALDAELRSRDLTIGARRLTKHAQEVLAQASGMRRDLDFAERCRIAVEAKASDLTRRID